VLVSLPIAFGGRGSEGAAIAFTAAAVVSRLAAIGSARA
jgi:hypothetical protein